MHTALYKSLIVSRHLPQSYLVLGNNGNLVVSFSTLAYRTLHQSLRLDRQIRKPCRRTNILFQPDFLVFQRTIF